MEKLLLVLLIAAYMVVPIILVTGWMLWRRRPAQTFAGRISLVGFVLGTASAFLAVCSILYSVIMGGFRFYDPVLLRIYKIGLLLSLGGLICAVVGIFRRSPLRWHAPALSFGMLMLWFMWAAGE